MSSINSGHHAQIKNDLKTFHLQGIQKYAAERAVWGIIVILGMCIMYG